MLKIINLLILLSVLMRTPKVAADCKCNANEYSCSDSILVFQLDSKYCPGTKNVDIVSDDIDITELNCEQYHDHFEGAHITMVTDIACEKLPTCCMNIYIPSCENQCVIVSTDNSTTFISTTQLVTTTESTTNHSKIDPKISDQKMSMVEVGTITFVVGGVLGVVGGGIWVFIMQKKKALRDVENADMGIVDTPGTGYDRHQEMESPYESGTSQERDIQAMYDYYSVDLSN